MSVASAEKYAIGPPSASIRRTCGSRMPSGKSPRIFDKASRTSLTARSTGVPIVN
jgi:hypothetical protein